MKAVVNFAAVFMMFAVSLRNLMRTAWILLSLRGCAGSSGFMLVANALVYKRAVGFNVSFSTVLSHNQNHIGIGQTIKFDRVLLNEGLGYNAYSGTFTVPAPGVYLFAYYFGRGYDAGQVWLELMKNGRRVNAGVTDAFHKYQDLQGGNIAIVRAETGDSVWVQTFHQNAAALFGTEGFTTFSGVLLY